MKPRIFILILLLFGFNRLFAKTASATIELVSGLSMSESETLAPEHIRDVLMADRYDLDQAFKDLDELEQGEIGKSQVW